jgi:hypothetical protein
MKPMLPKKRAFFFFSFLIIFLVVVPFIILFSLGYRFTNDYTLDERGGIYVFVSKYGSEIFIDNELKKTTGTFQRELFVQNLKPKSYLVIVSNENFQPWAKNIDVKERTVSPVFPFLVPKKIEVREISSATSTQEYKKISDLFLPPKTTSLVSGSVATSTATSSPESAGILKNKMKIWVDDNKIFAKWVGSETRIPPYFCEKDVCFATTTVFENNFKIKHLDFYTDRDDAVVISVGDSIYATEIDTRNYQNFYSLYKGTNPDFRILGGKLYVKDGKFIAELMDL